MTLVRNLGSFGEDFPPVQNCSFPSPEAKNALAARQCMIKAVKVPIFLGRNRAVRDRFLIKLLGIQRGAPTDTHSAPGRRSLVEHSLMISCGSYH
jgi:hypothetical protein